MDFRIFVEPQQGASYDELLRLAQAAEQLGYDAFFRSDHYLAMGDVDPLPGPTDSWVTLGGLARETSRIRLGTLVASATFRLPGPLAVAVAQVDQMSGGRVELGLGSGWFRAEHAAYGIPFPKLGQRFDRFEEQLAIITGLWATPIGEKFSYSGTNYTLVDSPALPKPTQQPGPPIIIGGSGLKRTPALAARYAAEFNAAFSSLADAAAGFARVRAAASAIERDPDSIVLSVAQVACVGADDAEVARRAAVIGRSVDDLKASAFAGTPDEVVDKIGTFAAAGTTRFYLQTLDIHDLDHIALIADEVVRQL
ncbi:MAG: F420-dependent oxidoreductase [Pseudonocardiales bacterium]|nr:F420-dependent oxidoreductase [Pseudonocardiales bacterium]